MIININLFEKMTEAYKNLSLEDMPGEIWKDIPGYSGLYQVSNMGRVKRLERIVKRINRGNYKARTKILRQYFHDRGKGKYKRMRVALQINKKISRNIVKNLVFNTFYPDINRRNKFIFHKDLDHHNCKLDNLYAGSNETISDVVFNMYKQKHTKTSKYKGVHFHCTRGNAYSRGNAYYVCQIRIKGKVKAVNFNADFNEHSAELKAAKKYDYYVKKYKLNRQLNFPDERTKKH